MFRKYIFTFSVLSLLVMGQAITACAADSCQPVFDALQRLVTIPSHSYSTGVVNGKPTTTETIYVHGRTYMLARGKWMLSPVTPNDVLEQEVENEKQGTSTCQLVRNEPVKGEPAAVYSLRRKTDSGNEDGLMWISKLTGLALRKEVDMDYGGKLGKMHLVARFEYSNVKPPM